MMVKFPREIPQKVNKHFDKSWLFHDPSLNRSKVIEQTRLRHILLMAKVPREITHKI